MLEKIRLFIGAPIDHHLKDKIISFIRKQKIENIRWTKPENLHITCVFIGEKSLSEFDSIKKTIKEFLPKQKKLKLKANCFEWAPPRRPYMIWMTFEKDIEFRNFIISLHRTLEIPLEWEEPTPHITIARLKKGSTSIVELSNPYSIKGEIFKIKKIILYQSTLMPDGPIYTPLEEYELEE